MSNRPHNARRHLGKPPRRTKGAPAIADHGFVGLRLTAAGVAIDNFHLPAAGTDLVDLLHLDLADNREWALLHGVCLPAQLHAAGALMLQRLINHDPGRVQLPDDPAAPAALLMGFCDHLRLAAAHQFHCATPELLAAMNLHPTAWLLLLIAPGKLQ